MKWTTEPPKVPGWYWWRARPGSVGWVGRCYGYRLRPGAGLRFSAITGDRFLSKWGGEWSGPIPPPEEGGGE